MTSLKNLVTEAKVESLHSVVENGNQNFLCFTRFSTNWIICVTDGVDMWRMELDDEELESCREVAEVNSMDSYLGKIRCVVGLIRPNSSASILIEDQLLRNFLLVCVACRLISTSGTVVIDGWQLDLQLPVQSVPVTTNVVSSNPAHGEVYSIQHYVMKFVSDLRQVGGFLRIFRFPPPIKLTATILLNLFESGVQHHNPPLFLYRSVHPFKWFLILNVTLGLTFDENIQIFSAHDTHIREPL